MWDTGTLAADAVMPCSIGVPLHRNVYEMIYTEGDDQPRLLEHVKITGIRLHKRKRLVDYSSHRFKFAPLCNFYNMAANDTNNGYVGFRGINLSSAWGGIYKSDRHA